MESVRAGAPPIIRFYRWSPACLSLGRNQPAAGEYDRGAIRALGIDVVRRLTGGRAVLHHRELTYSACFPDGALGSPREAYASLNRGLALGLRLLGVPAELQGASSPPGALSADACFRHPAAGEVVADGRKLIGSAQVREGGVTLQHGSLLFGDDQDWISRLLIHPRPTLPADAPAVLQEFLDPLPDWSVVSDALVEGLSKVLGGEPRPVEPLLRETRAADSLVGRYADPAWSWRY